MSRTIATMMLAVFFLQSTLLPPASASSQLDQPGSFSMKAATQKTDTGDDVLRILAEVGGTIVGGVGAFLIGAFAFLATEHDSAYGGVGAVLIASLVGGAAALALAPLGLYLGGEWTGGDSNYAITVAGFVGGTVLGSLIIIATDTDDDGMVLLVIGLAMTGGILAYELANEPSTSESSQAQQGLFLPPGYSSEGPFFIPVDGGGVLGFGLPF